MKFERLRDVKGKLRRIIKKLPEDRSVVITKNGRPCAVLLPVTLFAAAAWRPAKFTMALPATAVFVAMCLAAWGARTGGRHGS